MTGRPDTTPTRSGQSRRAPRRRWLPNGDGCRAAEPRPGPHSAALPFRQTGESRGGIGQPLLLAPSPLSRASPERQASSCSISSTSAWARTCESTADLAGTKWCSRSFRHQRGSVAPHRPARRRRRWSGRTPPADTRIPYHLRFRHASIRFRAAPAQAAGPCTCQRAAFRSKNPIEAKDAEYLGFKKKRHSVLN